MTKIWSETLQKPAKTAEITESDSKMAGGAPKPHMVKPKRKAVWCYLTPKEKRAVESAAIEKEESLSEFIRNAVKRAAKC